MNQTYVYQHKTKDTNEVFYIGISKSKNFRRAYTKYKRSNFWKNVVEKHDYIVEILYENLSWNDACDIEKNLIAYYGRRDLGSGLLVNLTNGGDGTIGILKKEVSLSTRKKISNSHLGKKLSEETKRKLSEVQKGKKLSEYTKNKMSQSRTGINRSEETKLKISKNNFNNKKVIDISTKIIYNSIKDASVQLNINYTTLKRYLSGKRINKTTLSYEQI